MLNELLQCRDSMLFLSVEQLISFYAPANDITALFFLFFSFFFFWVRFWMLIDIMFARDMFQVYEINDDWLTDWLL